MRYVNYITAIIFIIMPFFSIAASLDDAVNYKSLPDRAGLINAQAYTVQELVDKLPAALDEKGVFNNGDGNRKYKKLNEDARVIAFNNQKFGGCEAFYLFKYGAVGTGGLENTLRFAFPRDENTKINASNGIKHTLSYLKESTSLGKKCENRDEYLAVLKDVFNAVIQSSPNILQERLRIAEVDLQIMNQKKQQRDTIEASRLAEGKAIKDDLLQKRNETIFRNKKYEICRNTNDYKFYELSKTLEFNNQIIESAKLTIKQQEDGAKISGFVDKNVIHKMGITIVNANHANDENYEIYKKMGGSAKRKELVRGTNDPCTY